jgi:hypothetical protein
MSLYEEQVMMQENISFKSYLSIAKKLVPPFSRDSPLYQALGRGTAILKTDEQLNAYLAYYGQWHWEKFRMVLPSIKNTFKDEFDLVDWGCGIGIGLFALRDQVGENHPNLRSITLVDPSVLALHRAKFHAHHLFPNASIRICNKTFEELNSKDFTRLCPIPRIHFFSNVLDMHVFNDFEDPKLKEFILTLRGFAFSLDEFFVCISPSVNNRISEKFEKFLEIIGDEKRWIIKRILKKELRNTRPTLIANVTHYKSKLIHDKDYMYKELGLLNLHEAATLNDTYGVEILISQGAELNTLDEYGLPPIICAIKTKAFDVVKLLIKSGANINATDPNNATALHFAVKLGLLKLVQYLLQLGADPEIAVFDSGNTPLMIAIINENIEAVKILLKYSRLDVKNARGLSPIQLARLTKNKELKNLIEEG